jgi:hypothetical protein
VPSAQVLGGVARGIDGDLVALLDLEAHVEALDQGVAVANQKRVRLVELALKSGVLTLREL